MQELKRQIWKVTQRKLYIYIFRKQCICIYKAPISVLINTPKVKLCISTFGILSKRVSKCGIFQKHRQLQEGRQSRKECIEKTAFLHWLIHYLCGLRQKVKEWIQALYMIKTEQPFFARLSKCPLRPLHSLNLAVIKDMQTDPPWSFTNNPS